MISTPHSTLSRRATLLIALACAAVAPRLWAQDDRLSLPLGTRVRILGGAEAWPFTGNVLRVTPDTLAVAVGGGSALIQFPTSRLTSLEVSEGRDRLQWGVLCDGESISRSAMADLSALEVRGGEDKRRGFLIGAGIAGGITAVFGGIDASKGRITNDDLVGTLIVNSLIGGLVGYAFAPKGWERIPLPGASP